MTGALRFERVKVLLADPDRGARDSLRTILHNSGFRRFETAVSIDDIRQAIRVVSPDLLIISTLFPDGDPCALVHAVRHHEIGNNPFLPVFMLTSDASETLVRRAIDSGVDDLLIRPVSAAQVLERLAMLATDRKPFVVTAEYIGPDRRSKKRRDDAGGVPLIDAPNTLGAKASGEGGSGDVESAIAAAAAEINIRRLKCDALQIGVLVETVVPALEDGEPGGETRLDLAKLGSLAEDAAQRLKGTPYAHAAELSGTLTEVSARLQDADHLDATDVQLLTPLSQAIAKAFDVETEVAAAVNEIVAHVRGRERRRP
jgi:DNA-binding response OmpR family regulator